MTNFMYKGKNILTLVAGMSSHDLAKIALRISETHPDAFAEAVVGEIAGFEFNIEGKQLRMTQGELAKLDRLGPDKIDAIKNVREMYGLGLREAKLLSEKLARDGYLNRPHWLPETNQW